MVKGVVEGGVVDLAMFVERLFDGVEIGERHALGPMGLFRRFRLADLHAPFERRQRHRKIALELRLLHVDFELFAGQRPLVLIIPLVEVFAGDGEEFFGGFRRRRG